MSRRGEHRPQERSGTVVLAAVNDSPTAPGVARWAGEMARAANGTVVVFTAVPVLPQMDTLAGTGWIDERRVVREDGAATVARVLPILDSLGVRYRIDTRPGIVRWGRRIPARGVARSIRRAARDVGADLIVVGSRGGPRRTGSDVAARLVGRARVDVLVVPLEAQPSVHHRHDAAAFTVRSER